MDEQCTIYRTADFIGKRWTLLILLELYKGGGSKRYSSLKKSLPGITPKMLSLRLKELGEQGMVGKKVDTGSSPVRCIYSLTRKGSGFMDVIRRMKKWSLEWDPGRKTCAKADCAGCRL